MNEMDNYMYYDHGPPQNFCRWGGDQKKTPHKDPHIQNKVENCPPYGEKCSKKALTWRKSSKNAPHIAKKMLGDFLGGEELPPTPPPPPEGAHDYDRYPM